MTVEYVTGDLFDPNFGFDAIGHGVNCKGKMGSGIAVEFKKRYPRMYSTYFGLCGNGLLLPGQVMPWRDAEADFDEPQYVYNIASQYFPGKDGRLGAIEIAMHWVDYHATTHDLVSVGLPRIGAGIAGLSWPDVCATIESVVGDSKVLYTLVSLPDV